MRWEEIVGRNVKRLRKLRDLTQEALADAAEIDPRSVRGIESGEQNTTVAVLGRLAGVLGVHPARLFDDATEDGE